MAVAPQDLKQALDERLASGDVAGYVEAEIELENSLMRLAEEHLLTWRFGEAADAWETVATLNRELVENLGQAAQAQGEALDLGRFDLDKLTSQANLLALVSSGRAQMARGQHLTSQRNPGAATALLKDAQGIFQRAAAYDAGLSVALAGYAGALTELAAGSEDMLRGDFDSAALSFMRARVGMENLIEETLPRRLAEEPEDASLAALASALRSEAFTIASQYEKSSFLARIAAGEYGAAADHAENLRNLLQSALDSLPEEAPRWQRYGLQAQLAWAQADKERASAFVFRKQERWDEAQAAYERARTELGNAANFALRTGLPDAAATQESLMAMATVTIAPEARQARAEQQLREEINELRAERRTLIERISSAGVTVNNAVDAVAVAEQNTQIAVQVTQSVRNLLPELRAALESGALGTAGRELGKEVAALEASDEPPAPFLERVKTLTRRVADIVKNVGEAAGPLIPVIQKLAPLVGLALAL